LNPPKDGGQQSLCPRLRNLFIDAQLLRDRTDCARLFEDFHHVHAKLS
jgi:hypothetical protein